MRRRTRVLVALVVGAVAAVVFAVLGVQLVFACGWGVLVAALVVVIGVTLPDDPRVDAPIIEPQHDRGSDVSRLAWSFNPRTGVAGEAVTRRVRALLRRRLARAGIDPDDTAEAESRVGGQLWARLDSRRASAQDIRDALAAAERLARET